jgi:porphobilinogen synthase
MAFPVQRPRRLRTSPQLRRLVAETRLTTDGLIFPLFVHTEPERVAIESMPGQFRWPVREIADRARETAELGIPAIMLFGIPKTKDATGTSAYDPNGVVQTAVRAVKDAVPDLLVIADTCLDEYTDHGHCGILVGDVVDNDATIEVLARVAVSQANAGFDLVAPSDMMDGRVAAIRNALDQSGRQTTGIMAYSAKYASAFYGPFREAAGSTPRFGDRRGYQMDTANAREALKEVRMDIAEGADIVMVKPALSYLDIIRQVRDAVDVPVAAYNVSGEYSMVKAAAHQGWIDEKAVVTEILTSIARAGADIILTYHAQDVARWLQ